MKLVITSIREGAKTRSVKTMSTFKELTRSFGSLGAEKERFTVGIATLSAPNEREVKSKNSTTIALILTSV